MNFSSLLEIAAVKPREDYFFDYSALVYRKATPEEYVRSGIVRALQTVYGYLPIQISTEAPLWKMGRYRYRADVILWEDASQDRPFALFEAKAPAVGLTSNMLEKLDAYSRCLRHRPQFLILTNRKQTTIIRTRDGCEVPYFPTLKQSVKGFHGISPLPPPTSYRRPAKTPFELDSEGTRGRLQSFPELAISDSIVPLDAKRAYVGIYELLLDESVNLAAYKPSWAGFRLLEDRFVRWSEFGNASGGRFYGKYRHLVLETPSGRQRDFCISVSTYAKYPGPGVKSSSLAIVGGIDGKQSLQLQSDVRTCRFSADKAMLCHRGYVSLGEGGRIAAKEVFTAVRSQAPELIDGGEIIAAQLDSTSLRGAPARHTLLRLAVLAHILDSVRTKIRRRKQRIN